jgi:hypothetical protein
MESVLYQTNKPLKDVINLNEIFRLNKKFRKTENKIIHDKIATTG